MFFDWRQVMIILKEIASHLPQFILLGFRQLAQKVLLRPRRYAPLIILFEEFHGISVAQGKTDAEMAGDFQDLHMPLLP